MRAGTMQQYVYYFQVKKEIKLLKEKFSKHRNKEKRQVSKTIVWR